MEIANLGSRNTGIPDVVIWVGMDPIWHGLRVKVSNSPNRWYNDNFTITIPGLDIVGNVASFIRGKTLNDILSWVKLNIETIIDYEKGEIVYTDDFLARLRKI